jgi:hypothetical protein
MQPQPLLKLHPRNATEREQMTRITELNGDQLARSLAYAGYVLLAFELTKSLIVKPIKSFYYRTTFGPGMPFKSYEEDVLSRNKNEFEACLLYLRDFMEAIDAADFIAIQRLRKHRNELAHDLPSKLTSLDIEKNQALLDAAHKALFKLSNYRAYMEIGHDPNFRGIDWDTFKGTSLYTTRQQPHFA